MNQNKHNIKWLSWLPAVIMMIVIFLFSAKTAEASDATSSPIAAAILRIYEAMFGKFEAVRRIGVLDTLDFIVRKTAHITEYAILAICISFGFWVYNIKAKKRFFLALIISVFYAGTDEYHQTFIDGRSGSIRDVGIDSIGVIIGCCIFILITHCIGKRKKKRIVNQ